MGERLKILLFWPGIALMRDDISLAKITTKPRFDNANCKFYHDEKNTQARENTTRATKV